MRLRVKLCCFGQALLVLATSRTWSDPKDGKSIDKAEGISSKAKSYCENYRKFASEISLAKLVDDVVAEFHDFPGLATANEIGQGFVIGLCCGYFVKKTTKVVAFTTGGIILGIEGLRASGVHVKLPDLSDKMDAIDQFLKEKHIDINLPSDYLSGSKELPSLSSVIMNSDRNLRKDIGLVSGAVIALLYF